MVRSNDIMSFALVTKGLIGKLVDANAQMALLQAHTDVFCCQRRADRLPL